MITLELKGFYRADETNFTAIAPVWCDQSAQRFGQYPNNHFKFTGRYCGRFDDIDCAPYNPENVFSDEAWLEVDLYLNRFQWHSDAQMWLVAHRCWLGGYVNSEGTERQQTHRFFLPKVQLRSFFEMEAHSPKIFPADISTYNIAHATCFN